MANVFEDSIRNVIPNWRSFHETVIRGELNSSVKESTIEPDLTHLDKKIAQWKENQDQGFASDLLSTAYMLNVRNNEEIEKAANFILKHANIAPSLLSLANAFAHVSIGEPAFTPSDSKFNFFAEHNLKFLYSAVHNLKKRIINFPGNAITWVDLSRLYSILGQNFKAKKMMMVAYSLAKENRFVLRSLIRLFAHIEEEEYIDKIHSLVRNSGVINEDPWVMASEIALASLRKRGSQFVKKGLEMVKSNNHSAFNLTELTSAIATIEFNNGSLKRGKEMILLSLKEPNDNSLAQAEWLSNRENLSFLNNNIVAYQEEYFEALARDSFQKKEYKKSLDYMVKWFVDLPYALTPVAFGSYIAMGYLKDYEIAKSLCQAGLVANINDPILLNNLIYAYLMTNDFKNAETNLERTKSLGHMSSTSEICLTATKGLYFFRKGFAEYGRSQYLEAIKRAKNEGNILLYKTALLNYTREELIAGTDHAQPLIDLIKRTITPEDTLDLQILKDEIFSMNNITQ